MLLGMNDPSFVPPVSQPPPSRSPNQFRSDPSFDAQRLSQEALDEQFARKLAQEEQEAVAAREQALQDMPSYIMYQPYQTRRGGRNGWGGRPQGQPQTQGQGGKDTMTEFQEGFNRIAECTSVRRLAIRSPCPLSNNSFVAGKKTFSSIMSKVRAKMQDFDQGQGWSGSHNPHPDQAPQASSLGQQQNSGQGAYAQPYAAPQRQTSQPRPAQTGTSLSSPPRSGILRPAATEPAQPSYYDPNTRGYDLYGDEEEIQLTDKTTPAAAAAPSVATQHPATSPRTDSPATTPPPSETSSLPSYASPVLSPSNPRLSISPPARSLSPTIAGAKAATPGAPGGVDFSTYLAFSVESRC